MFVVTLTGGIGAGKTEAAEFFRHKGAVVVDLDDVASHLLGPGSPIIGQIADAFGDDVVSPDGVLDRAEVARRAFESPESARRLNDIVHPSVVREVGPALTDLQLLPHPPNVVVVVVPLLVEAPVFAEFADDVLAITASKETRATRATGRGLSAEDVEARMRCQATDEARAELADHVVVNEGTLDDFQEALGQYWDEVVSGR
jgi:dephospho-CoA kinase